MFVRDTSLPFTNFTKERLVVILYKLVTSADMSDFGPKSPPKQNFDVSLTFCFLTDFRSVENFDILITSSFNEN